MNTNLGPIWNKTNVINFMTKIGLRLGMLVNTTPGANQMECLGTPGLGFLWDNLRENCTISGNSIVYTPQNTRNSTCSTSFTLRMVWGANLMGFMESQAMVSYYLPIHSKAP